jgi:dienelactone hydrolase
MHTGIEGDLRVPADAKRLVIFAQGRESRQFGSRNQLFAQTIRKAGIGTLIFNLLTKEEEAVDRITHQFRFNIPLLAERLVRATRWVKKQPATEHLRTGYFGSSTSGAAALVAAAEIGDEIGAVVSRGGRPDLAGEALPNVLAPALFIIGELDDFVLELNKQAYEKLHCEKELKVVPGASHRFEEAGTFETVAVLAADWFKKYLQPEKAYRSKNPVV